MRSLQATPEDIFRNAPELTYEEEEWKDTSPEREANRPYEWRRSHQRSRTVEGLKPGAR